MMIHFFQKAVGKKAIKNEHMEMGEILRQGKLFISCIILLSLLSEGREYDKKYKTNK